jgi:predicted nucleotidyltransferase
MPLDLTFDQQGLEDLCRRYRVAKLELFGSRAKGTARPDSDVDLLVTFETGYTPGLEFFSLGDDLERIFGHRVDLLTRPRVERDQNPYFRQQVLATTELLYAA